MYLIYSLKLTPIILKWIGFEPMRVLLTELQSAAFDHSATSPLFVPWLGGGIQQPVYSLPSEGVF